MSLPVAVRLGVQTPRVQVVPEGIVASSGPEAVEFGELVGVRLDPWQLHILNVAGGERADGSRAAKTVDVLASRQNGKNAAVEVWELFCAVVLGEGVLHTAHEFKTSLKAHKRIKDLINSHPDVQSEVVGKWATPAQGYLFEFKSGGKIEFVARSGGSGRGFTDDVLILDEAQALTDEHLGALMPALSARSVEGDPQVWYLGSAPSLSQIVWQRRRKGWRAGGGAAQASFEFSAHPDSDLDDRDAWAQANPGLGIRISEEFIESAERSSMSDEEFAKERLSISPELADGTTTAWPPGVWDAVCSDIDKPSADLVFTVDVNPERSRTSIGVAGRTGCGLVDDRPGVGWSVDELVRLAKEHNAPVALASASPAGSLIVELERRGVVVQPMSQADVRDACGWFFDAVAEQKVAVKADRRLDGAVAVAVKKASGDGFVWDRRGGDVCPLVAVTFAAWAQQQRATSTPAFVDLSSFLDDDD